MREREKDGILGRRVGLLRWVVLDFWVWEENEEVEMWKEKVGLVVAQAMVKSFSFQFSKQYRRESE